MKITVLRIHTTTAELDLVEPVTIDLPLSRIRALDLDRWSVGEPPPESVRRHRYSRVRCELGQRGVWPLELRRRGKQPACRVEGLVITRSRVALLDLLASRWNPTLASPLDERITQLRAARSSVASCRVALEPLVAQVLDNEGADPMDVDRIRPADGLTWDRPDHWADIRWKGARYRAPKRHGEKVFGRSSAEGGQELLVISGHGSTLHLHDGRVFWYREAEDIPPAVLARMDRAGRLLADRPGDLLPLPEQQARFILTVPENRPAGPVPEGLGPAYLVPPERLSRGGSVPRHLTADEAAAVLARAPGGMFLPGLPANGALLEEFTPGTTLLGAMPHTQPGIP